MGLTGYARRAASADFLPAGGLTSFARPPSAFPGTSRWLMHTSHAMLFRFTQHCSQRCPVLFNAVPLFQHCSVLYITALRFSILVCLMQHSPPTNAAPLTQRCSPNLKLSRRIQMYRPIQHCSAACNTARPYSSYCKSSRFP